MSYIKGKPSKDGLHYTPKNKEKYRGKFPIWCRSTWEYKFAQFCDMNPKVFYWSSEPIHIPYQHPIEQRDARYFPDYLMKCETKSGEENVYLVEVKPYKETHPPRKSKKKSKKTMINEAKTWEINKAKWNAANKYCKLKGWIFKIVTEKELFGGK